MNSFKAFKNLLKINLNSFLELVPYITFLYVNAFTTHKVNIYLQNKKVSPQGLTFYLSAFNDY